MDNTTMTSTHTLPKDDNNETKQSINEISVEIPRLNSN